VAAVILQAMPEVDWFKLVAFVWFAGVGSVTPGPNNAIALSTAANFGARAVVPHSIGVAVGFSTMLVGAGLGTYGLLLESPALAQALKLFGVLYLCWLGVQLARSGTMSERAVARAPRDARRRADPAAAAAWGARAACWARAARALRAAGAQGRRPRQRR